MPPLISLLVPTRNRLPYLKHTLQSALDQNDSRLEIIVADNATEDGTREYLASLGTRIKMVRSETPLSMTENWHRGLAAVTGEWVIVIGDDDALLPPFMAVMSELIGRMPDAEMISWTAPIYRWPDAAAEQNMLSFQFSRQGRIMPSADTLRAVFEDIANIFSPPGLYHTLTRTRVLDRIKAQCGEYWLGLSPDVGSGLLHLAFTENYLLNPFPMSVMGFSKSSTGMSFRVGTKDNAIAGEFRRLSDMEPLRRYLPEFTQEQFNINMWRMLLEWQDYIATKGRKVTLNQSKMLLYCIDKLSGIPKEYHQQAAIELIAYGRGLGFDEASLRERTSKALAEGRKMKPGYSIYESGGMQLAFDLSETPIKNITDAGRLICGLIAR